jgi:hypothetical protein
MVACIEGTEQLVIAGDAVSSISVARQAVPDDPFPGETDRRRGWRGLVLLSPVLLLRVFKLGFERHRPSVVRRCQFAIESINSGPKTRAFTG